MKLEAEIKLIGVISKLLKPTSTNPLDATISTNQHTEFRTGANLIYSHSLAQKILNFQDLPLISVSLSSINCELLSDVESKSLELNLDSIQIAKNMKAIEIVEVGRKHRSQNMFKGGTLVSFFKVAFYNFYPDAVREV